MTSSSQIQLSNSAKVETRFLWKIRPNSSSVFKEETSAWNCIRCQFWQMWTLELPNSKFCWNTFFGIDRIPSAIPILILLKQVSQLCFQFQTILQQVFWNCPIPVSCSKKWWSCPQFQFQSFLDFRYWQTKSIKRNFDIWGTFGELSPIITKRPIII